MFENMWYTFMLVLLILNGTFVAISFLPVTQDNSMTLGDVWGTDIIKDMNGTINIFGNQFSLGTNVNVDVNSEATTSEDGKVDIFKSFLFGAGTLIGGAAALMNFMAQALFGYFFWLDFLLNPMWHPIVAGLNLMLKTVFFIIEIVGLVSFAKGFFIFRNLF
jgi:hypothetical protein